MGVEEHSAEVLRNIELARSTFGAFNRGDIDEVLARLAPDVEVYSDPALPNSGTFHGPEGWLLWFERWVEAWETFTIEVEEIFPEGDELVVCVLQHGRGRGSGVEVTMRAVYVLTVREGKTTRLRLYPDKDTALKVVRHSD